MMLCYARLSGQSDGRSDFLVGLSQIVPCYLTNMESDRVSWVETDKVDRFRRAHAQRHVAGAQTSATRLVSKKTKSTYNEGTMICKYFQEGTCRFPTHHKTAGQFYRHVCENCNGTHTTKKWQQKTRLIKMLRKLYIMIDGCIILVFMMRIC